MGQEHSLPENFALLPDSDRLQHLQQHHDAFVRQLQHQQLHQQRQPSPEQLQYLSQLESQVTALQLSLKQPTIPTIPTTALHQTSSPSIAVISSPSKDSYRYDPSAAAAATTIDLTQIQSIAMPAEPTVVTTTSTTISAAANSDLAESNPISPFTALSPSESLGSSSSVNETSLPTSSEPQQQQRTRQSTASHLGSTFEIVDAHSPSAAALSASASASASTAPSEPDSDFAGSSDYESAFSPGVVVTEGGSSPRTPLHLHSDDEETPVDHFTLHPESLTSMPQQSTTSRNDNLSTSQIQDAGHIQGPFSPLPTTTLADLETSQSSVSTITPAGTLSMPALSFSTGADVIAVKQQGESASTASNASSSSHEEEDANEPDSATIRAEGSIAGDQPPTPRAASMPIPTIPIQSQLANSSTAATQASTATATPTTTATEDFGFLPASSLADSPSSRHIDRLQAENHFLKTMLREMAEQLEFLIDYDHHSTREFAHLSARYKRLVDTMLEVGTVEAQQQQQQQKTRRPASPYRYHPAHGFTARP
ncbi:hypothetical protein RI367_003845 [Sorochytrium milnesiophthora]